LHSGKTNSCHRVEATDIDPDNFNQFHNTPKKLQDRELMLKGQWPTGGCEYCEKIETAGGSSDRKFHLAIPNMSPPELDTDVTAVEVTPRIVEVYFDNTCNMSCIYCWDGFSSQIQQENIRFGRFEKDGMVIENRSTRHPDVAGMTEKFWDWLDANYATTRRLHILGGEPFYQQQFDHCLEFLGTRSNPELEFNIVSNLMVAPKKFREKIYQIKQLVEQQKIARFDLTCSIDCWGRESEYIRSGLDLERWRENFEFLVNEDWITLNVNQTISGLSIKATPELIAYINEHRNTRPIGHYFMTINNRSQLNPDIFGGEFFAEDFERILEAMPDATWQQQEARKYMQGIQLQISKAQRDAQEIHKLIVYLTELDRRRHTNWRTTFPWLTEFEHYVV